MILCKQILESFPSLIEMHSLDPSIELENISPTHLSTKNSICYVTQEKYLKEAIESKAGLIIVSEKIAFGEKLEDRNYIVSPLAELLVQKIQTKFFYKNRKQSEVKSYIDSSAVIHSSAKLGENCYIGPHVVIGEQVTIGSDVYLGPGCVIESGANIGPSCQLFSQVYIGSYSLLGANCIIQSHSSIGIEPFLSEANERVVLEDSVEVGSHCTVEKGVLSESLIKKGTKLDNMVHISHSSTIGAHSLITAGNYVGSNVVTGHHYTAGGNGFVESRCKIADAVTLAGMSYVEGDIEKSGAYGGQPLQDMKRYLKTMMVFAKLPELRKYFNQTDKN